MEVAVPLHSNANLADLNSEVKDGAGQFRESLPK